LGGLGLEVTVVERSSGPRSSGSPVDVRGPAWPVVERMVSCPRCGTAATAATRLCLVDGHGRAQGWIPTQTDPRSLEIPRSDLAAILTAAAHDRAEFSHGDSVRALHDDGRRVHVTFEAAAPRPFDLVVGADGLHSRVRRLAFGGPSPGSGPTSVSASPPCPSPRKAPTPAPCSCTTSPGAWSPSTP
jgi:2-polyprenyl-6-methoxyphenol hydroxylase-like FAD-dependent oxidoreductase